MFSIIFKLCILLSMVIACHAFYRPYKHRKGCSDKEPETSNDLKTCQEMWYSCQTHQDCCSQYCLKLKEWPEGACQPKGKEGCHQLWYYQCKADNECCSDYCYKQSHWKEGVCKTKNSVKSNNRSGCHELWYNRCQTHKECCSKYCFKEPHWAEGVCKPRPQE